MTFALLLVIGVLPGATLQAPVEVTTAMAAAQLVERVEPEYPPIAIAANAQGNVKLRLVIGTDGAVRSVRVINGLPILHFAATEAVKKWRYKPFSIAGRIVETTFEVEIPFVIPGADAAGAEADRKASNALEAQNEACERALRARAADADAACLAIPALAEKLSDRRQLDRAHAYDLVGAFYFGRESYREALDALERGLAARLKNAKPGDAADADVGMSYFVIGSTHGRLGNLVEARRNYERAESIMRKAIEWAAALPNGQRDPLRQEFQQRYSENLRTILTNLVSLLKAVGDTAAAAAAQQRLDALK